MIQQNLSHDFRHTICGPFDSQFRKKFLGKKITSLSVEKFKIIKAHQAENRQLRAFSQKNLLPKIKEIQKITKDSKNGKKKVKLNKYVDGVSDLQLYIAKKLMNHKSTKQIVDKISKDGFQQFQQKMRLTSYYKSNLENQNFKTQKSNSNDQQIQNPSPSKTSYQSQKKWVTDKQFTQKFDKFIVVKNDNQSFSMKKAFGDQQKQTEQVLINQLVHDKQVLTKIVKKMIQDHNYESEIQGQQKLSEQRDQFQDDKQKREKDINWILKECDEFDQKFKIKKHKSRNKLKHK